MRGDRGVLPAGGKMSAKDSWGKSPEIPGGDSEVLAEDRKRGG